VSDFSLRTVREWLDENPNVTCVNVNAYSAALDEIERLGTPLAMLLWCPACNARHIDEGDFATKPHHTHACQNCGHVWRPAIEPTCGVHFLPGFKNTEASKDDAQPGPCLTFIQGFCPGVCGLQRGHEGPHRYRP
jgi:hypothetical protein